VKAELAWLEEQGLITNENLKGTQVATITQRGIDVATGQATHPGVKRPSPV
jgi:DNA-binding GntR family transcriptional regulator